ncbi:ATP-binding cassette domain-containing protein [Clostridium botulinum]|uniref:ATP-binding cassette domain-containing protein n=1 Tax=Clostridium TaxID=1485 RepID=UPI0013FA89B1|nr:MULTISPECIES: ATP-binding cassette domain-containing protein [Clostridium]MCS6131024.1 ATP-binding cassette domain-containing protein [Clostridium botulinum]NFL43788.1 ATP-binding cassette domain-containing protein [Clostridium botulinum]NFL88759.1 ATP-binding cassette domain-containing protein [Clostridium botulinum]
MVYLEIKNIFKKFGKSEVLNNISFDIAKGEFLCILGPSGCGKTTLLRIISGLDKPNKGSIYVKDRDITKSEPSERNCGMVFQNYVLFPNMTAEKNIAYGLKNKGMSKVDISKKMEEVLNLVGLFDLRDKYPHQLSGGQQQRVALARAIAVTPDILLLDEPLSALDAKSREVLRAELKTLQKKLGITTIMVTHDQEEALIMADKIIIMNKCEIMQVGTPIQVYNNPKNKFIADFMGNTNFFNKGGKVYAIRPENVEYSLSEKEDFYPAIVKMIEFRGAFYRIMLELEHIDYNAKSIFLNLGAKKKELLNINEGMKIFIKLQENMLLNS